MAVEVRGEGDAFLLDLAQSRKGEHLEAAGVRQDRAVPVHELMQSAHLAYHVVTRAEMEMVGVGQLDLTAELLEVQRAHAALDRRLRADVHENRRLHLAAVGALEFAAPGLAFVFDDLEHSLFLTFCIYRILNRICNAYTIRMHQEINIASPKLKKR